MLELEATSLRSAVRADYNVMGDADRMHCAVWHGRNDTLSGNTRTYMFRVEQVERASPTN
jgi:hypothetical protein